MKRGMTLSENQFIKISREQLYNEIWEISVTGVAKKYNVPYAELLRLCKEIEVPIPPSGYWTKLNYGKQVFKTPLPESSVNEVILPTNVMQKHHKSSTIVSTDNGNIKNNQLKTKDTVAKTVVQAEKTKILSEKNLPGETEYSQLTYRSVSGEYNTYNREKLYDEIWSKPVVEVAIQYGVSDVAIHKICKSLNVPAPPRGYWTKLRAGEKVERTPLTPANGITEVKGAKTFEGCKVTETSLQLLSFLTESERQKVLLASQQIQMPDENAHLHKKIITYKSVIREWNKSDMKTEGSQRSFNNFSNRPPFLAGVISSETLPRVFCILDALFLQIEYLGGSVNDNLSLNIRNENVHIEVIEAQDEIKHEITREEAKELLIYEDAKRHNRWGSEPKIRKYDYVFNGHLRITIRKKRYFRDTDSVNIESRLGEMLVELYEESEVVRIDREAREEEQRKQEEEKRLREEQRILYNAEVERTIGLVNTAQDYDVACKIRFYISALESSENIDDKTAALIDWAKKKADWFDPSIARVDELFGKREYEKNEEQKALEKSRSYWW